MSAQADRDVQRAAVPQYRERFGDTWLGEALCFAIVFAAVLALTYFGEWQLGLKNPQVRWVHRHVSDILMALLVAFLSLVLMRADRFVRQLAAHREAWTYGIIEGLRNQQELAEAREQFIATTRDVRAQFTASTRDVNEAIKELCQASAGAAGIWGQASVSVAPTSASTILKHLNDVGFAWAKLICVEDPDHGAGRAHGAQWATAAMQSACWEQVFRAYLEEELRDLGYERAPSGDLMVLPNTRPTLATNYPTYLNLLERLSTAFFTKVIQETELMPCFLAVADNLPIEWVMHCQSSEGAYMCAVDPQHQDLADWRSLSRTLGVTGGGFLKRVFLTREDADIVAGFDHLPKDGEFERQLGLYVWARADDAELRQGVPWWKWQMALPQFGLENEWYSRLRVERDSDHVFFVSSRGTSTNTTARFPGEPPISVACWGTLKEMIVSRMHAAPRHLTVAKVKLTTAMVQEAQAAALGEKPTDLLMVGLHNRVTDRGDVSVASIHPLLGVECLGRAHATNTAVLRLYTSGECIASLMPWFTFLCQKGTSP